MPSSKGYSAKSCQCNRYFSQKHNTQPYPEHLIQSALRDWVKVTKKQKKRKKGGK